MALRQCAPAGRALNIDLALASAGSVKGSEDLDGGPTNYNRCEKAIYCVNHSALTYSVFPGFRIFITVKVRECRRTQQIKQLASV